MLGAETHGLRGQEQHRHIVRQVRQASSHQAINQHRVHTHRQVRAMLLGRGHGQHGNGALKVKLCKFQRGQVGPKS